MLIFYGVRIRLLLVYALSSILELLQTCKFWHLFLFWKLYYAWILCYTHRASIGVRICFTKEDGHLDSKSAHERFLPHEQKKSKISESIHYHLLLRWSDHICGLWVNEVFFILVLKYWYPGVNKQQDTVVLPQNLRIQSDHLKALTMLKIYFFIFFFFFAFAFFPHLESSGMLLASFPWGNLNMTRIHC